MQKEYLKMSNDLIPELQHIVADYSTNDDIKKLETINPVVYNSKTAFLKEVGSNYDKATQIIDLYLSKTIVNKNNRGDEYLKDIKFKNIDLGFVCCILYNLTNVEVELDPILNLYFSSNNEIIISDYLNTGDIPSEDLICILKIHHQCIQCYYTFEDLISNIVMQLDKDRRYPSAINHLEIINKYHTINNVYINHNSSQQKDVEITSNYSYDYFGSLFGTYIVKFMWPRLIHTKVYNIHNLPIDLFYEAFESAINNFRNIIVDGFTDYGYISEDLRKMLDLIKLRLNI
jgi:hypothetical protein